MAVSSLVKPSLKLHLGKSISAKDFTVYWKMQKEKEGVVFQMKSFANPLHFPLQIISPMLN